MLKLLTCDCGGVDSLVRGILNQAGVSNWMTYEIHKGKEHCQTILDRFPEKYHGLLAYRALADYLKDHGTFAIIIGYDDNSFFWQEVRSNAPKDVFDAIGIIKRFA